MELVVGYSLQLEIRNYTRSDGRIGLVENIITPVNNAGVGGDLGRAFFAPGESVAWTTSDPTKVSLSRTLTGKYQTAAVRIDALALATGITITATYQGQSDTISVDVVEDGTEVRSILIQPISDAPFKTPSYVPGDVNSSDD
jgi:hypothetical protein